jgi:predicted outer membrane repeat protein
MGSAANSITIGSNCVFSSNTTLTGNGGAIAFYTDSGTLCIYGSASAYLGGTSGGVNDTEFTMNTAAGLGGAVYQSGGTILAVGSPADTVGFDDTNSDDGAFPDGNALYLTQLTDAHIDIPVASPPGIAIYLVSSTPPQGQSYFWSYIDVAVVAGGPDAIYSNWPYTN